MQLTHFYHRHHLHRYAKYADLHHFELTIWLHTVARSFIAVFIPILLYQAGYSVTAILTFYLCYFLIDVPLNFAVKKLIQHIGARKTMILGTFATMAYFGTLAFLPPQNWVFLLILALLAAIYDTLFWVAQIYLFTEANRGDIDTGRSSGSLEAIRKLAHIIGPIVGGLILISIGKDALIAASVIIFIISIIPLYRLRHVQDLPHENPVSPLQFLTQPQSLRDHLALGLFSVSDQVNEIILPLFIFILLGSIEAVAALPVILSLSMAIFSFLFGKLTKQYGAMMIALGSLFIAWLWLIRLFFPYPSVYFISIFFFGLLILPVAIPLDTNIINRGLKLGSLTASTYRNIFSMVLGIPLYFILIFSQNRYQVGFSLAAICMSLLSLLFLPRKPFNHHISPKIKPTPPVT